MPTVHQAGGLGFVVFVNDHPPAHVHAIGVGGEAKIELGDAGPRLVWVRGLSRADTRFALSEVAREMQNLRAAWIRLHGDGDD
ncbi:MAG TPA: DUF4160 domain-containing protein [Caulobacteraceae bacterium]|jgi:hypothetical protein